jgi:small subunit ribosomal protein S21
MVLHAETASRAAQGGACSADVAGRGRRARPEWQAFDGLSTAFLLEPRDSNVVFGPFPPRFPGPAPQPSPDTNEGASVQVLVRDNNIDQALKALKKKMQREGIFREMKLRGHYEKPSEKKAREKAEAIRRARKLARKKMQREGLLPAKPRPTPGGPGDRHRGAPRMG